VTHKNRKKRQRRKPGEGKEGVGEVDKKRIREA